MSYYFYILRCIDNSLYSGMTNDLEKRVKKHNSARGAKYVRARLPATLVHSEEYPNIQSAMAREREVKKWPKPRKEALITGAS